jgi:hypothetical protein
MAHTDEELSYAEPHTARLVRAALERVANKIERMAGNKTYKQAFKVAARVVRDSKPD